MSSKFFKYFPLLLILLISSCTADLITEDDSAENQEITTNEIIYEQGYIRILISENLSTRMENAVQEGIQSTRALNADDVLTKVKVRDMTRTFPHAGRFEARTKLEGLHLWYDVVFDTDISLDEIREELLTVAGITEVEFRPVVLRYGDDKVIEYAKEVASSISATSFRSNSYPYDDPLLPDQWHYQNDGSLGEKYRPGADINLFDAWNYTQGTPDVIVSVVDGGIEYTHDDLAANMWTNNAEKNGTSGIDDDQNGYRDDIYGYNFVADIGKLVPHDHGTHVAGTIAAVNNNGKGVSGIAGGNGSSNSGVRLMSCQIFVGDDDPYSTQAGRKGAEAIKYGADNGAVISQNSWGYPTLTTIPSSDKAAIDYFIKYAGIDENGNQTGPIRGGIVVFAAGNEDRAQAAPANYEPVIAVSSIAADFKKSYYSNYGEWIDLAAPGGDVQSFGSKGTILSTITNNKYGYMQGTSMACPHVSGVAALVVSKMKGQGVTPDMIKTRLIENADDINQYNSSYRNKLGKLVNSTLAVAGGGSIPPEKVQGLQGTTESNKVNLKWEVPQDQDDGKPAGFNVYLRKSSLTGINVTNPPSNVLIRNFAIGNKNVGDTFEATVEGLDFETQYYIAVSAYDISGNLSPLSSQINVTTKINNPPVITTSDATSFEVKAHQTHIIRFIGTDPDNHEITWSLDPEIQGIELIDLGKGNAQLSVSGTKTTPGKYNTDVVLTDMYNAQVKVNVSFTVFENRPPEITKNIDNLVINGVNIEERINLNEYFKDIDEETLKFKVDNSATKVVHANTSEGILYIVSLSYGASDISITASDALGKTVSQDFKILVKDSNSPVDIYPNPVKDKLWIRTEKETQCRINIYSSSGALIYKQEANSSPFSPHSVDASSFAAGVYSVSISYDGKEYKKQIIKQ